MKLKQAASNPDIEVVPKSRSISVNFSTGSYVATVLPLVKAWQDIEGEMIDEDQVDGMMIKVIKVEMKQDLGARIVGYLVKMDVEGHEATIHLYDTTLSILVQASLSILEPYCSRALVPYLEKQIILCRRNIMEINEKAKHMTVPRRPSTSTKSKKCELLRGPPILELPSPPRTPELRPLSSLDPPAGGPALPWAGTKEATQQQPEILIQAQNILEPPPSIQLPRQRSLPPPSNPVLTLPPPSSHPSLQVVPLNVAGTPEFQEAGPPDFQEAGPPDFQEAGLHPEVTPCPVLTGRLAPSIPPRAALSSPQVRHDPVMTPGLSPWAPLTMEEDGQEEPVVLEQAPQVRKVAPEAWETAPDPEELLYPQLTHAGHLAMAYSPESQVEEQCATNENADCNPCGNCDAMCRNEDCLKSHIEMAHEQTCYPCNMCDEVCSSEDSLKSHVEMKHAQHESMQKNNSGQSSLKRSGKPIMMSPTSMKSTMSL